MAGTKANTTVENAVANALDAIEVLEKKHLPKCYDMQSRGVFKTTDNQIRAALLESCAGAMQVARPMGTAWSPKAPTPTTRVAVVAAL